ncbi:MAG: hypothetical protein IFK94_00725 [Acidobacteria bacterium]|uniref:Uncharacterized protein n=1 Tax=Candidatus Polarisedimenticola svalbardensis TaxID=2886004 RepID=A0A8J6XX12_9BACT|nr:hypothetical protein [Candidatus Polarisedimenticola svalbardensis]
MMLQPIDLNLGTRPFRNNTLIWTGLGIGLLVVVWLSWWNYTTWQSESDALLTLRSDVNSIESQLMDLNRREMVSQDKIKAHDLELLSSQAGKANDVIMLKAFSWTRLFNRLETIQPYEVRMQAVRPVFRLGKKRARGSREADSTGHLEDQSVMVTVDGTAKNLKSFLAFETSLLEDQWFDRVEPERYSTTETGETQFSLRFHYYPNKLAEEPAPESEAGAEGEAEAAGEGSEESGDRQADAEATGVDGVVG